MADGWLRAHANAPDNIRLSLLAHCRLVLINS
jgi:hypothetical protein